VAFRLSLFPVDCDACGTPNRKIDVFRFFAMVASHVSDGHWYPHFTVMHLRSNPHLQVLPSPTRQLYIFSFSFASGGANVWVRT
jgi:hypothetical protein